MNAGCTLDAPRSDAFAPQTGVLGPIAFSSTTAAAVTTGSGARQLLVAYEQFAGALNIAGEHIVNSSTVNYAYSTNDGETWTNNVIPVPPGQQGGVDTIIGEIGLGAWPTVPPFMVQVQNTAVDSLVYIVAIGQGGNGISQDRFRTLMWSRSTNGGRTFSTLQSFVFPNFTVFPTPSRPSVALAPDASVEVAFLSGMTEANPRVLYTRSSVVNGSVQFSTPVSVVPGTNAELGQIQRVILREGVAGAYVLVERVEPLPLEERTATHDARLHLSMFRRRTNGAWEAAGVLNENPSMAGQQLSILVRAGVESSIAAASTSSHIDFQRIDDVGRVAPGGTAIFNPLVFNGRSHVVWAGHDEGPNAGQDQVWYQSFATNLQGAQGYQDTVSPRVLVSTDPQERVFQPTVTASESDVFVTWYQQNPTTLRVRLMGRRSDNGGATFGPVIALSSIDGAPGPTESVCPSDEQFRWSRESVSVSYIDAPLSTVDANTLDLFPSTSVTFHTRGRDSDCSMQSPNTTLYQEAAYTRWR